MISIATKPFNLRRAGVGALIGLVTGALGFATVSFLIALFSMFLTSHDPMEEALKGAGIGGAVGALLFAVAFGRGKLTPSCSRCGETAS